MAKQVASSKGNKKAPDALMAKAGKVAVAESEKAKEAKPQLPVVTVKATAISKGVGLAAIKTLASTFQDEDQIAAMRSSVEKRRWDVLASLTGACVKALQADTSINLVDAFKEAKDMIKLNDQLGLALEFKQVYRYTNKTGVVEKIDYTPEASALLRPGEHDDEALKKRKGTVRSNFLTQLKKAFQAAVAIVETKTEVKTDKATGTLLLSGPAIKKQFGQASVLLNEQQTVKSGDKEVKLKEKPSFQAMANRAAEMHGKVQVGRVDSRKTTADPDKHMADLAGLMVKAIESTKGKPTDAQKKAMETVRNAIDVCLGG